MRGAATRVKRLEAKAGTGKTPIVIVSEGQDGVRRNMHTGEPVTPPTGALVIVFRERPDGPQ